MSALSVDAIAMNFGGLRAVDRVTFAIQEGQIHGLSGPNGAGKTTVFNCITGFYHPTSGAIRFQGRDITQLRPDQIARLGIARTFQNGLVRDKAQELMEFLGLADIHQQAAGNLSLGLQKRLELGRALGLSPKLLLLDEPAAGLNATETQSLAQLLFSIRDRFKLTILLVEHDMGLVMNICDTITVLNFGQKIAEGTPHEVQNSPEVIKAYLGETVGAEQP